MKLGEAVTLALVTSLTALSTGCKSGCDEYVDEVKSKAKECEVDALKDGPGDVICTDSSKKMAGCQAKCVKAVNCDVFECLSKTTDAELSACLTLLNTPTEDLTYKAYGACVDACEQTALCDEGTKDCSPPGV